MPDSFDWKQRLLELVMIADAAVCADLAYMTESQLFGLYLFLARTLGGVAP